ncbi:MAG: HlyC/CorC family transporter [Lachnospiraceae bacterium]|nr:HlyC/CorC family transporter [Lachnospiraceae bacterium]
MKKLEKQEVFLLSMDPDPRSFLSYLFVAGLVLLAGFFSGSETAYASCSRVRLMAWADDGKKSASRALSILEQFDKALITLLIGNNVIHVIATSTAAVMAIRLAGPAWGPVFSTVIMTLLVFIFSETIPKNIAKANSDHFACAVSLPLRILIAVLTPLDLLFMGLGKLLRLVFRSDPAETAMTEDDFHSMIETIEDEGGLEADESELIQSAVEFTDRTVAEILTPRVHMVGLDLTEGEEACRARILEEKYSRLPVYERDLDHIVGLLSTKQYLWKLLNESPAPLIRSEMTQPLYTEESAGLHELLEEMRRRKVHLAIVRDRFGGTAGMVTMEDLLEEIVGDIWDEDEEVHE